MFRINSGADSEADCGVNFELNPELKLAQESELTWESQFAPVTESELTPGLELAPE